MTGNLAEIRASRKNRRKFVAFGLYQKRLHQGEPAPNRRVRRTAYGYLMISLSEADAFVAELADLFARFGALHYGEDVSQLEHAIQTAHHAKVDGAPPALIVAALLHDIGHLIHKIGDNAADLGIDTRHEHISAGYLARAFGPEVTEPVRLHVAAKRYRVAVDPTYFERLSKASLQSLALQGGPMIQDEIEAFLAEPAAGAARQLRSYDEAGKAPHVEVAGFETYYDLLRDQIDRAGKI